MEIRSHTVSRTSSFPGNYVKDQEVQYLPVLTLPQSTLVDPCSNDERKTLLEYEKTWNLYGKQFQQRNTLTIAAGPFSYFFVSLIIQKLFTFALIFLLFFTYWLFIFMLMSLFFNFYLPNHIMDICICNDFLLMCQIIPRHFITFIA